MYIMQCIAVVYVAAGHGREAFHSVPDIRGLYLEPLFLHLLYISDIRGLYLEPLFLHLLYISSKPLTDFCSEHYFEPKLPTTAV